MIRFLLTTAFVALGASALASAPSEYDVKAAFLLNVLRLSERRPPISSNQLVLCAIAADSFEQSLRSLEGTSVHGRKLMLRRVGKGEVEGCEAIFFGRTAGMEAALIKAQKLGILTVGNDTDFLPLSGMVALVVENRRVVVEINRLVLNTSHWTFSSHLLEIARLVSGGVQ